MIRRVEIPHQLSFQYNQRYTSDNPLDEVWDRIRRFGSIDYLNSNYTPDGDEDAWTECKKYAQIRLRQAIELRESSMSTTFLTKPLILYYSFLNILRSFLALKHEVLSSKRHGLSFNSAADVLSCGVTIHTDGTFGEYLSRCKSDFIGHNSEYTLSQLLEQINELNHDLTGNSAFNLHVYSVQLTSFVTGRLQLTFLEPYKHVEDKFGEYFPKIAEDFERISSLTFSTPIRDDFKNFDNVKKYVNQKFETDLLYSASIGSEKWYVVRYESNGRLTRSAYYYLALFILSNVVRYEPQSLLDIYNEQSDVFWILNRFVRLAERYYPQLVITELNSGGPIYF